MLVVLWVGSQRNNNNKQQQQQQQRGVDVGDDERRQDLTASPSVFEIESVGYTVLGTFVRMESLSESVSDFGDSG